MSLPPSVENDDDRAARFHDLSVLCGAHVREVLAREDPWVQTRSGKAFHLLRPTPEMVDILDVAHSLSKIVRFHGHTYRRRYTVAEHSLAVSYLVPREDALEGLLHDAAEAYVGDIVNPLKRVLGPLVRLVEEPIEQVIAEKYGLRYPFPASVREADLRMCVAERNALMSTPPEEWKITAEPAEWSFPEAEPAMLAEEFLTRFYYLERGA